MVSESFSFFHPFNNSFHFNYQVVLRVSDESAIVPEQMGEEHSNRPRPLAAETG